ncbi:MAG: response regulator, partial [Myxococcota bacterium]
MAKVLVIDDNDTIREGVVAVCERLDHDVEAAESGEAGVARLADGGFDLVLTDLKMDGLDGIGVLKAVKAHDESIAVMIITAYATIETAVEAIKLGAFDYIEKPFSTDTLRIKVNRALEWHELQKQNARLAATNEVLSGARDARAPVESDDRFEGMIGT